MRPLSINEITNLSEKLVANEHMSSELGELLIFTYKYMIQAVKDRDDIIKHLKAGTPKTKEFKKNE